MKRAIQFKLKNGKTVTIRRTRGYDYEAQMKFMEKFSKDPGAFNTWQYAGQPKKDKEKSIKMYESNDCLFVSVWDGNNIIAMGNIEKYHAGHPYSGRSAGVAVSVLQKYTHNGIGSKLLEIFEKWAHENNIHVLYAGVRHTNLPSLGNCMKHGYEITGIKHDSAYINGKWIHEYILEKIIEK